MYDDLLHVSGNYPAYKIEERITFSLIHANLYLFELYDERDEKSATADTFDISCVSVGSRYEL